MMLETVDTLPDNAEGEDIVWTAWQHAEVRKRTGRALQTLLNIPRAMASYGICVGVLGALRATGIPFFEVTPTEVKMALTGYKNASKDHMITSAMRHHPNAPWPLYKTKGSEAVSSAKAEHMADAIGAIYAGIHTNAFMQLQTMLK